MREKTARKVNFQANAYVTRDALDVLVAMSYARFNNAFYCVPAEIYEKMMDRLEDLELLQLVKERQDEESVSVNLDDL